MGIGQFAKIAHYLTNPFVRREENNSVAAFDEFDVEKEKARLRKLSDEELIQAGKVARYLCSSAANFGKPPREIYVVGLRLCKQEWRRRHPKQSAASD